MAILGLILIVIAALMIAAVLANGGGGTTLDLTVFQVDTTVTGVFVAGAVTLLVLVVGLWLVKAGLARTRRRRQEVKALRHQAEANQRRTESRASWPPEAPEKPAGGATRTEQSGDDPDQHFDSTPREG